jgi:flavin-dependent dehydrogenase
MEYHETIIVGAGPAGSSCAWKLKRANKDVLILDKAAFPRLKLCAGWITTDVLRDLEIAVDDYPHSIVKLSTRLHIAPLPFALMPWPTHWTDYSIRRIEFDHWLVERSGAPFKVHQVNKIDYQDGNYILDDQFACRYLIGAGGTGCPVRRHLFPKQRIPNNKILALEKEFYYPERQDTAHFFFFDRGLWGYSWYVPKGDGYLNIGLGGFAHYFKNSSSSIQEHFCFFLQDLSRRKLLDEQVVKSLKPDGYAYYLWSNQGKVKQKNCWLIGDAAGIATIDFAEGIGPSIKSGLFAADEILGRESYSLEKILNMSIRPGFQWMRPAFLGLLSLMSPPQAISK